MSNLIRVIILSFFILFSFSLKGNNDWQIYTKNNDIKIEYKYLQCVYQGGSFDTEYVVLKVTNLKNTTIYVDWNLELWYDNICYTNESEGEENRIQSILLNTNEVLEGNCLRNSNLRIFAKFIQELETMPGLNKITELTKFELKNINITYE